MEIYKVDDVIRLKKKHPCGCDSFSIIYCASDVKLKCVKCGRDIIMPRVKVDKYFKEIINV